MPKPHAAPPEMMIRFSFRIPFTSIRLWRWGASFPVFPFVRASVNRRRRRQRRMRR
jgi:hypothetical protein